MELLDNRTALYFKLSIYSSTLLPLIIYISVKHNFFNIAILILFSISYISLTSYCSFFKKLKESISYRLVLDNIFLAYLIFFNNLNPIYSMFFFYGFSIQTLISDIINILLFNTNKKLRIYFSLGIIILPISYVTIAHAPLAYAISGLCTALLILIVNKLLIKIVSDQYEKNKKIVTLKDQQLRKQKTISELKERLQRHEVNNLLMRIAMYVKKMNVQDDNLYYEKLGWDIKRLSNFFTDMGDVPIFSVISLLKETIKNRFKEVNITIHNLQKARININVYIIQALYICIENSCEAGAKNVSIEIDFDKIIVRDDGKGFDTNNIKYGYSTKNKKGNGSSFKGIGGMGLQTTLDLLNINNIQMDIESKKNIGTIITIKNFQKGTFA